MSKPSSAQYQTTLREPIAIEGVGLHTGAPARVEIRPAAPDAGLFFRAKQTLIPAFSEYVVETARATVIGKDGVTISTVEHLLSALFGMGVSNAEIVVEGPEIPVADGSAKTFADAIAAAGVVALGALRPRYVPTSPSFVREGDRAVIVLPAASFRVRFVGDYAPPIGSQYVDLDVTPENYLREIAAARTFGYLHEVESLLKRGLARGGTLENALVFAPEGPMQELRWPNEPVRHKMLDLLGDFALLGAWPQCEVIAIKSGHRLHCIATSQLRSTMGARLPSANAR